MAIWMIYVVTLTAVVMVAAVLAERAVAHVQWPRRWVWATALGVCLLLPFSRRAEGVNHAGASAPAEPIGPDAAGTLSGSSLFSDLGDVHGPVVSAVDRVLIVVWLGSSALYFAWLVNAAGRLRRARREWSRSSIAEHDIWISPSTGPAVIGIARPTIVLPRWILTWSPGDRDLVIRHEVEHAAAHDPWLNLAGLLAVGFMPWNIGLWWGRARLVQAMELDCDLRVLSGDPDPDAYARVLVEVSRWTVPIRAPVVGLQASRSPLERRVEMVLKNERKTRLAVASTALAVAAAVAAILMVSDAPAAPDGATLEAALPIASLTALAQEIPDGGMIEGRLPFTPTPEQTSMALATHHPRVLGRGLPADQRIWFVIDSDMQILHTGIGPAEGLHERVRAMHPEEVTDYWLGLTYQSIDGLEFETVWFVPDPTGG